MSNDTNDIVSEYRAEVDEQSFKQVGSILDRVIQKQKELNAESAKSADLAASLESRKPGSTSSGRDRSAIEGELRALVSASDAAAVNVSNTSSELQLLGSTLGRVGGEAGRTANEIIALASRLPDIVDGLGNMGAASDNMIAKLDKTADSIGVPGGGIGLTAALVGLAVAAKLATEASNELEKQIEQGIETREFAAKLANDSDDELRQAAIEQQAIIDDNTVSAEANRDAYELATKAQNVQNATLITGVGAVAKLGQEIGVLPDVITPVIDAQKGYNTNIETGEANLAAINEEMERRNINLEEELDLTVENAAAATRLREFEREALAATEEQNAARAQGIQDRKSDVETEIKALEDSGSTSEKTTERLAELNSELETLNAQSEILSSSAVKSAEAQNAQAEATDDVSEAAENAAEKEKQLAQERTNAAQATADALATQTASMREFIIAGAETGNELTEQAIEQSNKLLEVQEDANKAEEKLQREFNKKRRALERNQSFLQLFDLLDGAGDEAQERAQEREDKLADLREGFEEERAELKAQAEATEADKLVQIQNEAKTVADAQAKEQQLLRRARDETIAIQQNRHDAERQLYMQTGQTMQQFSQQVQKAVGDMFKSIPGGAGGLGSAVSVEDQINAAFLEALT